MVDISARAGTKFKLLSERATYFSVKIYVYLRTCIEITNCRSFLQVNDAATGATNRMPRSLVINFVETDKDSFELGLAADLAISMAA
ncbi:uncharacterized protein PHALS_07124 [Plasmopara halstedii]|uniref:Uncharacterized protein n=1 Tax=Plasmopara halstedii TaxID=4781 RepID=A0A0P1B6J7_PLAHL|nr:uncharacterized protein PHALS_07124 [Plasmopara halstedii]CEG49359.1 hypothetical protein PHALS_07124 [Plasmopara halstedii]|eukprot:XP_024585728.1 hypothetical protein PHALS_07124 [Plasmopara halstedii]